MNKNLREHFKDEETKPNYAGFAVVGAGLGRTGTVSLKAALAKLLDGPCYHGSEYEPPKKLHFPIFFFKKIEIYSKSVLKSDPYELEFWNRALEGEEIANSEWVEFFQGRGFRAGLDRIVASFYKELMAAYPNTKVVLSVREPDKWYQSCLNTYPKMNRLRKRVIARLAMRMNGVTFDCMDTLMKNLDYVRPEMGRSFFEALMESKDSAIEFYHQWNEEVKSVVPKEKLLVFDVREGWEPLCKFLDVPVPDEPFPRLNDSKQLEAMAKRLSMAFKIILYGLLPMLLAMSMFWWLYRP